jgi:DNA-binding HxlR family transcriptional regulator
MCYSLTERGQSLRPVLKAIMVWGLRHPDTHLPESPSSDARPD